MVITPMLAKQLWLHLPDKPDPKEPAAIADDDNTPIVLSVTKSGELKINQDVVPAEQLSTKIKRALAASGQRTVFFDADEEAEFGSSVGAMDLARAGGATTIVVLTEPLRR